MRIFIAAAATAAFLAGPAQAGDTMSHMSSGPKCLQANMIDHTKVVDQSNILFYMRDGKVWHSRLSPPCVGIRDSGFVMDTHFTEYCGGSQVIHLIKGGATCQLGEFTPYH